jgi:Domain of unknown function (DUF4112)
VDGDAGLHLDAFIRLVRSPLPELAVAPVTTLLRMAGNVTIETVIGTVPIVGDLFDIAWKANLKNLALVRGHVANAGLLDRSLNQVGRLFLVPVMLAVLFLLLTSIAVVALVFWFVFG